MLAHIFVVAVRNPADDSIISLGYQVHFPSVAVDELL